MSIRVILRNLFLLGLFFFTTSKHPSEVRIFIVPSTFFNSVLILFFFSDADEPYKLVCYYANWAIYRPSIAKFTPQNINPYLCTHLIYAFGGLSGRFEVKPFDAYNDIQQGKVPTKSLFFSFALTLTIFEKKNNAYTTKHYSSSIWNFASILQYIFPFCDYSTMLLVQLHLKWHL